jgi:hypothetical protein
MDVPAEKAFRILREATTGAGDTSGQYINMVEQALSADERLTVYERVAEDEGATNELRRLVARKANTLRLTARLRIEETASASNATEIGGRERLYRDPREDLLFSPTRIAGNARERANKACRGLMEKRVQPVRVIDPLTSFVAHLRNQFRLPSAIK